MFYEMQYNIFTFGAPLILYCTEKNTHPFHAGQCPIDDRHLHNFVNNFDLVPRLLGHSAQVKYSLLTCFNSADFALLATDIQETIASEES